MDVATLTQLISGVGFPIACAVLMMYYVKYVTDKFTDQIKEITNSHKNEMSGMQEAVENNTVAVRELCAKLTTGE